VRFSQTVRDAGRTVRAIDEIINWCDADSVQVSVYHLNPYFCSEDLQHVM
jgi:phosphoribosyl-AMP cyclohydrolase